MTDVVQAACVYVFALAAHKSFSLFVYSKDFLVYESEIWIFGFPFFPHFLTLTCKALCA